MRYILFFSLIILSFLVIFTKKELYPLAPFTMYSYVHSSKDTTFLDLYLIKGSERIKVIDRFISPYDEARAKTIFGNILWANSFKNRDEKNKAIELSLKTIFKAYKNNSVSSNDVPQKCTGLLLQEYRWGSVKSLRRGIPEYIKNIGEYHEN